MGNIIFNIFVYWAKFVILIDPYEFVVLSKMFYSVYLAIWLTQWILEWNRKNKKVSS